MTSPAYDTACHELAKRTFVHHAVLLVTGILLLFPALMVLVAAAALFENSPYLTGNFPPLVIAALVPVLAGIAALGGLATLATRRHNPAVHRVAWILVQGYGWAGVAGSTAWLAMGGWNTGVDSIALGAGVAAAYAVVAGTRGHRLARAVLRLRERQSS